jgi:hypothetical protein
MKIWVRNLSPDDEANPDPALEEVKTKMYGGNTYFSTHDDPHHPPDSILEYLVTVRAGNEGPLTDRMYQIPKPDGLEYVAGETYLNSGEQPIADDESKSTVFVLMHEGGEEDNVIDTDQTAYITYQMKVIGGDGGGDGGSFPLTTGECKHDAEGLWAPDMNATKCKGVKWNADNGTDVAKNPVCWDTQTYGRGWQVDGKNPWVVGTATEDNNAAYDCRTKCADESGAVFGHCAADGWWNNETAKSTVCEFAGEQEGLDEVAIGGMGGAQAALFMDDKCL